MSIVITGASGKLGQLIIRQLLSRVQPEHIVACVRRPESAAAFEAQGVPVRLCDYDRPASLNAAFQGASRLLFISSPHPDDTVRIRQHAHVAEAAKQAGVGHVLYTSFAFADRGDISLTHLHLATEHALRTTGIPYTFLRNALYTDFVGALDLKAALATGRLTVAPGEWMFNAASRSELAAAAAAVLLGDGHENQTYELTASAAWTFEELAAELSALSGKPVTVQPDSDVRHWLYGFLRKIDSSSITGDLERLLGRPSAPLREALRTLLAL